jgi:hypothetical protein
MHTYIHQVAGRKYFLVVCRIVLNDIHTHMYVHTHTYILYLYACLVPVESKQKYTFHITMIGLGLREWIICVHILCRVHLHTYICAGLLGMPNLPASKSQEQNCPESQSSNRGLEVQKGASTTVTASCGIM